MNFIEGYKIIAVAIEYNGCNIMQVANVCNECVEGQGGL